MNQVQLSDVQIANLTLLLTIRDGIPTTERRRAAASRSTPSRPSGSAR